ncbi:MAG: TonB family protein [Bacteroidetes bacterium]|nr:TonB family protein [Bacteroidota bacterium]
MRWLIFAAVLGFTSCAPEAPEQQTPPADTLAAEEQSIPDTVAYIDTFTVRKPHPLTPAEKAEQDSILAHAAAMAQQISGIQNDNDESRYRPSPKDEQIILSPDAAPQFSGGEAAMNAWLKKNLVYPPTAWQNNVRGMVMVRFVVETDGSISNATITRSLSPDCDAAAMQAVLKMPKWLPGRKGGKVVRTVVTLPLSFVPQE